MYTFFVDLLKRGVFTLVGEIQRYRNDYYLMDIHSLSLPASLSACLSVSP